MWSDRQTLIESHSKAGSWKTRTELMITLNYWQETNSVQQGFVCQSSGQRYEGLCAWTSYLNEPQTICLWFRFSRFPAFIPQSSHYVCLWAWAGFSVQRWQRSADNYMASTSRKETVQREHKLKDVTHSTDGALPCLMNTKPGQQQPIWHWVKEAEQVKQMHWRRQSGGGHQTKRNLSKETDCLIDQEVSPRKTMTAVCT